MLTKNEKIAELARTYYPKGYTYARPVTYVLAAIQLEVLSDRIVSELCPEYAGSNR